MKYLKECNEVLSLLLSDNNLQTYKDISNKLSSIENQSLDIIFSKLREDGNIDIYGNSMPSAKNQSIQFKISDAGKAFISVGGYNLENQNAVKDFKISFLKFLKNEGRKINAFEFLRSYINKNSVPRSEIKFLLDDLSKRDHFIECWNYEFLATNTPFSRSETILAEIIPEGEKYLTEAKANIDLNPVLKSKKIFISHSSKDKEIADAFIDVILQGGLSIAIDDIFATSTDGTKIKSGNDWRNSIRDNVLGAKVSFLLVTPNYKESEVCMNEMGAAWISNSIVIPLIVEPINYKTVGVIHEPTQIEKLTEGSSLDRIKDVIQESLQISPALIKSDRWTTKKIEFLSRLKTHLSSFPFNTPMDRSTFNQLLSDKADLEKAVTNLIDEKKELELLIENLKKAKDKEEVKAILRQANSQYEEFEGLCKDVSKLLIKLPAIITGIIFKSYSGKKINIAWESYRAEIDDAVAKDFIDDDDLEVKWKTTIEMRSIEEALNNVSRLLNRDLDKGFYDEFENDFNAPLDIGNKTFWEEAFEVTIVFN